MQNMEYKMVELLSVKFQASAEEVVRMHVSYRFNLQKMRLQLLQQRLADISGLVKLKAPGLLLQLHKTPPRVPGMPPPSAAPPYANGTTARR